MVLPIAGNSQKRVLDTMSARHLRVAVIGNVDAGKSTLIGTLKTCTLDDGRGLCRSKIMKHQHEKDTGRTSTISQHKIGFDENGKILQFCSDEAAIALQSQRVVSLMDLAGHEKYFRTTVAGMSMGMADYALLLVNASQPPTHMTMNHLRLCTACGIPTVVAITKVCARLSYSSPVLLYGPGKLTDPKRVMDSTQRHRSIPAQARSYLRQSK